MSEGGGYTLEKMTQDIENINKLYTIINNRSVLFRIPKAGKSDQIIKNIRDGKLILTEETKIKNMYDDEFFKKPENNNKLSQIKQFKNIVDKTKEVYKTLQGKQKTNFDKYVIDNYEINFKDMLKSFNKFWKNNDMDQYNTVEETQAKQTKTIEEQTKTIEEKDEQLQEKEEKLKKTKEILKKKKEKLAQTNEDLNKKQEILQNIVSEGAELKKAITTTKQQLANLKNKALEIAHPHNLLMEGKAEIDKQYAKMISMIKYKEEELEAMTNRYNEKQQDYNDLQKDLEKGEEEKEKLKSDIIELNKQSEEKLRKLKEYDNELLNRRTAEAKHKGEEQGIKKGISLAADKVSREEATETDEIEKKQIKPEQQQYIKNKVMDGIYKLPREEIIKAVQKDINDGKITTDDPEKLAAEIYLESVRYVKKNARSIAKLLKMQGYNPTQFSQLPGVLQQYVNDYVTEKNKADLINKNKRYILPKDLPRWERATQQHNVNPMLGRGAWSN